MKKIVSAAAVAVLAGCLSVEEPKVSRWPVDFGDVTLDAANRTEPAFGTVRLVSVKVRSPYDSEELTVLRKDGTLANDPFNRFAANPSLLLKGLVLDALAASGRFKDAVASSSLVEAPYSAEVLFTRLCLDCREEASRKALCDVRIRLVKDRESVALAVGSGVADAADGNYGVAFSKAVSSALSQAASALK